MPDSHCSLSSLHTGNNARRLVAILGIAKMWASASSIAWLRPTGTYDILTNKSIPRIRLELVREGRLKNAPEISSVQQENVRASKPASLLGLLDPR